ncbi:serine/arginine repetitive matrix protein 1-like isoform X2 [Hippopotamus amphibius kiboko]|uniref:serine/arginine repetitive matrix protein 1-like isoform X2 n=1 Tax=Hippopotamus amphibius kiboko TaxID=575201 RepID=UPI0025954A6E|nr:serine/arginine repetitive matrix protein 1-like isoform X2 [Hippopotamus amphibius kiboko]
MKAEQEPLPLSRPPPPPPPPRPSPQPTRALGGPAVRARERRKGRERRGIQLEARPGRRSDTHGAPWATAAAWQRPPPSTRAGFLRDVTEVFRSIDVSTNDPILNL